MPPKKHEKQTTSQAAAVTMGMKHTRPRSKSAAKQACLSAGEGEIGTIKAVAALGKSKPGVRDKSPRSGGKITKVSKAGKKTDSKHHHKSKDVPVLEETSVPICKETQEDVSDKSEMTLGGVHATVGTGNRRQDHRRPNKASGLDGVDVTEIENIKELIAEEITKQQDDLMNQLMEQQQGVISELVKQQKLIAKELLGKTGKNSSALLPVGTIGYSSSESSTGSGHAVAKDVVHHLEKLNLKNCTAEDVSREVQELQRELNGIEQEIFQEAAKLDVDASGEIEELERQVAQMYLGQQLKDEEESSKDISKENSTIQAINLTSGHLADQEQNYHKISPQRLSKLQESAEKQIAKHQKRMAKAIAIQQLLFPKRSQYKTTPPLSSLKVTPSHTNPATPVRNQTSHKQLHVTLDDEASKLTELSKQHSKENSATTGSPPQSPKTTPTPSMHQSPTKTSQDQSSAKLIPSDNTGKKDDKEKSSNVPVVNSKEIGDTIVGEIRKSPNADKKHRTSNPSSLFDKVVGAQEHGLMAEIGGKSHPTEIPSVPVAMGERMEAVQPPRVFFKNVYRK